MQVPYNVRFLYLRPCLVIPTNTKIGICFVPWERVRPASQYVSVPTFLTKMWYGPAKCMEDLEKAIKQRFDKRIICFDGNTTSEFISASEEELEIAVVEEERKLMHAFSNKFSIVMPLIYNVGKQYLPYSSMKKSTCPWNLLPSDKGGIAQVADIYQRNKLYFA